MASRNASVGVSKCSTSTRCALTGKRRNGRQAAPCNLMAVDTWAFMDQDDLEEFDELAGKFDAGMTREDAERRAIEEMYDREKGYDDEGVK